MQTSKDPHDAPLSDVACVGSLFSNSALSFILKVLRPGREQCGTAIDRLFVLCLSSFFCGKIKKKKRYPHTYTFVCRNYSLKRSSSKINFLQMRARCKETLGHITTKKNYEVSSSWIFQLREFITVDTLSYGERKIRREIADASMKKRTVDM